MKLLSFIIASALVLSGCGDGTPPLGSDAQRGITSSAHHGGGGTGKVTLCHGTGDGAGETITVSEKAVDAHLAHGDTSGPCGGGGGDMCQPEPYVDPDGCSPNLLLRTPGMVIADLRAARAAQNWTALACNYRHDAFVIDDQGILIGRTEIITAAQSLSALFDGITPTILQEDVFQDTVRELYTLDAGWVVIPDGINSYVVEDGLITRQTAHGLIKFTGPPPDQT